jgi:hypothetical protein
MPFRQPSPFRHNALGVQFPAGADWAWPYSSPPAPPPSNEVVQDKLSTRHGIDIGMQYGATFGAIAGLPIWGIERAYKKSNFYSEILKPYKTPIIQKVAKALARPGYNVLASLTGTMFVGATMGLFVGMMLVGDVRKRLLEINAVQLAQQQGIYTTRPPGILARMGIQHKPVNDPQMAYYNLVQNNLNPQNAFWHGVMTILILKFVNWILIPLGTFGLVSQGFRLFGKPEMTQKLMAKLKTGVQHWAQPVVIAKLALAPLMGGLIAEQLAPWMKRKLGITD